MHYKDMYWHTETPAGAIKSVSKMHLTADGQKTLCGVRPTRNAIIGWAMGDVCYRCLEKREKMQ